jgi:hypothetical protein
LREEGRQSAAVRLLAGTNSDVDIYKSYFT